MTKYHKRISEAVSLYLTPTSSPGYYVLLKAFRNNLSRVNSGIILVAPAKIFIVIGRNFK